MGYFIAVFGAFNVKSFGDSLFPVALYKELSKRIEIDGMVLFSPERGSVEYNGTRIVHSYDEFDDIASKVKFNTIIIGGGELLHLKAIRFENGELIYEPGEIWKKPIEFGKKYHIPVIINSVGMPYEFEEKDRKELEELFSYVTYISLRDTFSYQRFKNYFGRTKNVALVPESLWRIQDYFDSTSLKATRAELKNKYNIKDNYLVFQYGTTRNYQEIYNVIEKFGEIYQIQIVAIAINASHDDMYVINQLDTMNENDVILQKVLTQQEIIALISGAQLFVGTSLHGNLVSVAYHVKNILIDMYPEFVSKMDGFSEMLRYDENFVDDAQNLWFVLDKEFHKNLLSYQNNIVESLRVQTRRHYEKMADIICGNEQSDENEYLAVYDQKESGVLFKKAYFKIFDSNGLKKNVKCIAKRKRDSFRFQAEGLPATADSHVEFSIALSEPIRVQTKSAEELIQEKNSLGNNVYIMPVLRWKLKPMQEYNFECTFSDANLEKQLPEIVDAYHNLFMHNEQLILKEREYIGNISELTQKVTEGNEAQQKLTDKFKEQLNGLKNEISKLEALHRLELKEKEEELKETLEKKEEELAAIKKIRDADLKEIIDLKQEVLNKEGHIQLLLPIDREYQKIIHSKMFKIMRFICRTIDLVLFIPKALLKRSVSFFKMMTHVNRAELKIAWGYVKNEGIIGAYRHLMRDYHKGELKTIEVDINEEIYKEIQSIEQCDVIELPIEEQPTVSIIIPVYNQFTFTYYCIQSIKENSGNISYEIILADDCSTDLTEHINAVIKNLIISKTETNVRFLKNCNQAAKEARGKYILFLNNDTQVQKDWLAPLVNLFESDEHIGLVGSKLIYSDGTLQEAGGIIWSDGSGWNYGRNDDAMKPEYNYVKEVDYISGASIMIRAELWKQLGGFDELFAPAYCEDSDLAFQVRKAGFKVMYQPLSVVVHFEGKSNGTDLQTGVKKYQVENSLKLREKWKKELSEQYDNGQCVFKARERSKDKKVILVVDHYVPEFDKDAGSKTTFQYLKMFLKQGYDIKFLGDNFFQSEPYTTTLQQMGIEVLYGPWYAQHWQEWILENKNYIDFVYLNRPHITIKYIDFLREKTKIKCIYYGHDLHFLRLKREYDLTGEKKFLDESEEWKQQELAIMRKADISYYPSYIEKDAIHEIDPRINVKAITAYVYEKFCNDINYNFDQREGILFVGGFGHPPNEDAVLWFTKDVYPIIQADQNIPFYIVGSRVTEKIENLASDSIIVKGFVTEEELRRLYNSCKLVVVPLRYGAGVKGKVVEAMYYGAPIVTTQVGIEGIEGAEKIVNVADKAEDFAAQVLKLYNNTEQCIHTAKAYQEYVKENFSVDAVWKIVQEDFQ